MSTKCVVMTCTAKPKGLGRLAVLRQGIAAKVEVPMCGPCADMVQLGCDRGRRPAITPGGAIYFDDLEELLRPRA